MALFKPWKGLPVLERDEPETFNLIEDILRHGKFKYVEERAIILRTQGGDQDHRQERPENGLACIIDRRNFTYGSTNVIFKMYFSDGVIWIVKVPYLRMTNLDRAKYLEDIDIEAATTKHVRCTTFISVPEVMTHDASDTAIAGFGFPYALTTCLPGNCLYSTLATTIPDLHLDKVAKQLASLLWQLEKICFSGMGHLTMPSDENDPLSVVVTHNNGTILTSLDWFERFLPEADQNEAKKKQRGKGREDLTSLDNVLRATLLEDRLEGPFVLTHMNLNFENLLFDNDFNITGVLGWKYAEVVPLERLAVTAECIVYPEDEPQVQDCVLYFRHLVLTHLRQLDGADENGLWPQGMEETPARLSSFFGSPQAEQLTELMF